MNEDKTVRLVPCPQCKAQPDPACKLCNGLGKIIPGAKPAA
ncbi:MAG: hypothetical protein AAB578_04840 [Elusimicrobiota bacterium]